MNGLRMLSDPLKACVKGVFRQFGLEVKRIPPYEQYGWLRQCGIRTILDIGANVGQFAARIHDLIPDAALYSFEPLADCYEQLVKTMGRVEKFRALNFAVGDGNGRRQIYRNDYTPSSSLLPMDSLLPQSFPFAASAAAQEIEIRRLDDWAQEVPLEEPILMKIDVQGMEDKVLLGGEEVLARTSILLVETSFTRLYQGQALFDRIYRLLYERGFLFMGSEHNVRDPKTGRVLQCDSLFARQTVVEMFSPAGSGDQARHDGKP